MDYKILSLKIEEIKEIYRTRGISNLDKVEGIYLFNRVGKNFDGESYKKTFFGFIIRDMKEKNQFNMIEYIDGLNYFSENIDKWLILKEGDKYQMVGSDNSNKNFDHIQNEINFLKNNIAFTQISRYKSTNQESAYTVESVEKIFPTTKENNIFKTGTGFFISQNGYILTNNHVIENANNIWVSNQIHPKLKAQIIYVDQLNDIALLKVNLTIKKIPYNFYNGITDVGNNVFTLGYPLIQSMGKEIKLTNGILNSNSGYENDTRYYQFSAEIQPGNSGGPLFDAEGNIVGLVSAKHTKATNAGYALKSKFILNFLKTNDPTILKKNNNLLKDLNLASKYKILKDYVLLLEIE